MSIFNAYDINSVPQIVTYSSDNLIDGSNSIFSSPPVNWGAYDSVVLIDANIPRSYYNMPSGYNTFQLTEASTTTTVTLPVGTYTKNNLLINLTTALTNASPNGWTYTVSYSPITSPDTYFLYFSVSGNTSQPSITMLSQYLSPFRQLGLEDGTTYTFVGNKLSSVNCINLILATTVYLTSNLVQANNGILQQFLGIGTAPPLSMYFFQQINYDINAKYLNAGVRNSAIFYLKDNLFLPIQTGGIPFAFTVCYFKRSVTHEIIHQNLRIENDEKLVDLQEKQDQLQQGIGIYMNEVQSEIDKILTFDNILNNEPEIHYPEK